MKARDLSASVIGVRNPREPARCLEPRALSVETDPGDGSSGSRVAGKYSRVRCRRSAARLFARADQIFEPRAGWITVTCVLGSCTSPVQGACCAGSTVDRSYLAGRDACELRGVWNVRAFGDTSRERFLRRPAPAPRTSTRARTRRRVDNDGHAIAELLRLSIRRRRSPPWRMESTPSSRSRSRRSPDRGLPVAARHQVVPDNRGGSSRAR